MQAAWTSSDTTEQKCGCMRDTALPSTRLQVRSAVEQRPAGDTHIVLNSHALAGQ